MMQPDDDGRGYFAGLPLSGNAEVLADNILAALERAERAGMRKGWEMAIEAAAQIVDGCRAAKPIWDDGHSILDLGVTAGTIRSLPFPEDEKP